ncbi:type II toxin-antitoxin system VapC family toxin [Mycolicibacter longobardus]|uniref:Twitching motility protein PilT n=1 Tax=Mycolicibacter longobardus TaxID=1108812 RepID=A0A1X1YK83_9MYCO|nr:PIN domain-containing protein [Mycolicibacter longobardus]MCV7383802.1 PIN domain-containing protein [Mycolicibacter longobardus]ORW11430.1 twitching motility protein PilT [Mycolicibacter longobardus]
MIVIADSSGILALFNRSDPVHFSVRRAADAASALVVSPLALTEVHHVASVRASRQVADAILGLLADRADAGRVVMGAAGSTQLRAALDVRTAYSDVNLDLVDAMCVVLAAEYDTDAVLTLDRRDFRLLRPLRRYPAFRVLPDDLGP